MKKKKKKKIAKNCDRIFDITESLVKRQSHYGVCGDVESQDEMEEIASLLLYIRDSVTD